MAKGSGGGSAGGDDKEKRSLLERTVDGFAQGGVVGALQGLFTGGGTPAVLTEEQKKIKDLKIAQQALRDKLEQKQAERNEFAAEKDRLAQQAKSIASKGKDELDKKKFEEGLEKLKTTLVKGKVSNAIRNTAAQKIANKLLDVETAKTQAELNVLKKLEKKGVAIDTTMRAKTAATDAIAAVGGDQKTIQKVSKLLEAQESRLAKSRDALESKVDQIIDSAGNRVIKDQKDLTEGKKLEYLAKVRVHEEGRLQKIAEKVLGDEAPAQGTQVADYTNMQLAAIYIAAKTPEDKQLVEKFREARVGDFKFPIDDRNFRLVREMAKGERREEVEALARSSLRQETNFTEGKASKIQLSASVAAGAAADLESIIANCPGDVIELMHQTGEKIEDKQKDIKQILGEKLGKKEERQIAWAAKHPRLAAVITPMMKAFSSVKGWMKSDFKLNKDQKEGLKSLRNTLNKMGESQAHSVTAPDLTPPNSQKSSDKSRGGHSAG